MYFYLLKHAWHYAADSRKLFGIVYASQFIAMCFALANPYLGGKFFNALQVGGDNIWRNAGYWLLLLTIAHVFNVVLWHISNYIAEKVSFDIRKKATDAYYQAYTKLPMEWLVSHHSGETLSRVNQSVEGITKFPKRQPHIIRCFMNFAGSLLVLGLFSWKIALVTSVLSLLMIISMAVMDNKKAVYIKINNAKEQELNGTLMDGLTNIKTIITLRIGERIKQTIGNKINETRPSYLKTCAINFYKWIIFDLGSFALLNSIVLLYAWMDYRNNQYIMIGNVFAVHQYLKNLQRVFLEFGAEYENLLQMKVKFDEINPLLKEASEFREGEVSKRKKFNTIHINNLTFSYKQEPAVLKPQLNNINLVIGAGKKIAFIGESGSGKSTMLGILAGLFSDVRAEISVDGKKASLNSIAEFCTLVPQEPEIFENTLAYNICMGLNYSSSEINEALQLSKFDEVLPRIANGLDAEAKEKGLNISGGEKQRLALARGILAMKNSPVILLDEPTSSVDVYNENLIYDGILAKFPQKTIISAIHHLSLANKFDYIYVFGKGKIVEHGTPDELKKGHGYFARMSAKYENDK